MTVLDKTKELCDAIIVSDEFKELIRAETILINDPDAQDLLKRFKQLQTKLDGLLRQGKKATAEEFGELREFEKELNNDPSAGPYFKAQQSFSDLLSQINNMINEAIKLRGNAGGKCSCGKHEM